MTQAVDKVVASYDLKLRVADAAIAKLEDENRLLTQGNANLTAERDELKGLSDSRRDTIQGDRAQIAKLKADIRFIHELFVTFDRNEISERESIGPLVNALFLQRDNARMESEVKNKRVWELSADGNEYLNRANVAEDASKTLGDEVATLTEDLANLQSRHNAQAGTITRMERAWAGMALGLALTLTYIIAHALGVLK